MARKTIKQPNVEVIMGMCTRSELYFNRDFVQTEEWLLSQINHHQCFDFNYEPFQEDKLTIHLSDYKFGFLYSVQERSWEAIDLDATYLEKIKRSVQAKGYVE